MEAIRIENETYIGSGNRRALFDLHIPENFNGKLVIFVHGYKGFKDWGHWNLVDFEFTEAGFGFAKFNLSHNGGTHIFARDFPDLDAFSKNTYTKEVNDVIHFLNHLDALELPAHSKHLIGHSRGGGVILLAASEDSRIDSVTTWAAISSIERRMPAGEKLEAWREAGVRYELNTRTGQQMPIAFSMYEDFVENQERLNIQNACKKLNIPRMVIHGSSDEAVKIEEGRELAEWLRVPLFEIPNATHTFGSSHPMTDYKLPKDLKAVIELTLGFIGNI